MGKHPKTELNDSPKFVSITFDSNKGRLFGLDEKGILWVEALVNQEPDVANGTKYSNAAKYGKWIRYANQFEG